MQAWRTDGEIEVPAEKVAAFERLHGQKERAGLDGLKEKAA
jgi:hypothetical protein